MQVAKWCASPDRANLPSGGWSDSGSMIDAVAGCHGKNKDAAVGRWAPGQNVGDGQTHGSRVDSVLSAYCIAQMGAALQIVEATRLCMADREVARVRPARTHQRVARSVMVDIGLVGTI